MAKWIRWLFFILFVFVGAMIAWKMVRINSAYASVASIPDFRFLSPADEVFERKHISFCKDKVILAFFEADCHVCQKMLNIISKNMDSFKSVDLFFICTRENLKSSQRLLTTLGMYNNSNVRLLIDQTLQSVSLFKVTGVPSFFVYKSGKLINKVEGETSIGYLLNEK